MRTAFAALILLVTTAALAQEPAGTPAATTTVPDYSTQKLTQLFSHVVEAPEKPEPSVKWGIGVVEFKKLNMRWRIVYLPFFAPLPGSVRRTNSTMINGFDMLGVQFAQTPRTWSSGRELSKEMKRIERTEREKAKLKAKME